MSDNQIGFAWLYGLVILFVLGIIELLIIPAIEGKVVPPLLLSANQTLNASDVTAYTAQVADVIRFIDITMYVLMFAVVIFMVIIIFKKEEQTYQGGFY